MVAVSVPDTISPLTAQVVCYQIYSLIFCTYFYFYYTQLAAANDCPEEYSLQPDMNVGNPIGIGKAAVKDCLVHITNSGSLIPGEHTILLAMANKVVVRLCIFLPDI
jgi:hypothetical protein